MRRPPRWVLVVLAKVVVLTLCAAAFLVPPVTLFSMGVDEVHPPLISHVGTWPWFGAVLGYVALTLLIYAGVSVSQKRNWALFFNTDKMTGPQEFDADSFVAASFYAFVISVFGEVGNRIVDYPWFLSVFFGYFFVYSTAFAVTKSLGLSIWFSCSQRKHAVTTIVLTAYGCLVISVALHDVWKTYQADETYFAVILSTFAAFHLTILVAVAAHFRTFHLHHYSLPMAVAVIFGLNSSMLLCVLQAQALAVHVHGVSMYGVESLFHEHKYHKSRRRRGKNEEAKTFTSSSDVSISSDVVVVGEDNERFENEDDKANSPEASV